MGVPLPHSLDGHRKVRSGLVEAQPVEPFQQLARLSVQLAELVPTLLQLWLIRHSAANSKRTTSLG
jgi:hypothetical protein